VVPVVKLVFTPIHSYFSYLGKWVHGGPNYREICFLSIG
jgi:hypothetical protein